MHRRKYQLCLLFVTVLAACVRFWNLGEWSLWIDEAHTWRDATMPLEAFFTSDRAMYGLSFVGVRVLLALHWIGTSEWWLRLPFALAGIVSVPVMALAGRRLVGAWPALLASALLALDPWHEYWSQNARSYVLAFAFVALAANRAHAWIENQRTRDFVGAIAAIVLGTACHSTAALQIFGLGAFLALRRVAPRDKHSWLRMLAAAAVLAVALPWLVKHFAFFQDFLDAKGQPSLLHFAQTTAYYFRPFVLLVAAAGLWLAGRDLGRERALLLGCLFVVPFLVLLDIGGLVVKVTARYAMCTLPIVVWLAAYACVRLGKLLLAGRTLQHQAAAAALPLLLAADYGVDLVAYHEVQHGQRAQWREACDFARRYAGTKGMRVVTINLPSVLYYLRPLHWSVGLENPYPSIRVFQLTGWMIDGKDQENNLLVHEPGGANHLAWHAEQARATNATLFVIVTLPELAEADYRDGSVRRTLERDYQLVLHLPCWVGPKDESIYVYVPKGA